MKHTPVVVNEIRSLCCALLLASSSWCSEHNAVSPIDGSEAQTANLSAPQKDSQVAAGLFHRSGAVSSCCSLVYAKKYSGTRRNNEWKSANSVGNDRAEFRGGSPESEAEPCVDLPESLLNRHLKLPVLINGSNESE